MDLSQKKFGKYYEFLKISFGFLMVIYLLSILEVGQWNSSEKTSHSKKLTKKLLKM